MLLWFVCVRCVPCLRVMIDCSEWIPFVPCLCCVPVMPMIIISCVCVFHFTSHGRLTPPPPSNHSVMNPLRVTNPSSPSTSTSLIPIWIDLTKPPPISYLLLTPTRIGRYFVLFNSLTFSHTYRSDNRLFCRTFSIGFFSVRFIVTTHLLKIHFRNIWNIGTTTTTVMVRMLYTILPRKHTP